MQCSGENAVELLRVGWLRIALAEAWVQFRNTNEGECLPLDAVTR
jgi:hypothetical protein